MIKQLRIEAFGIAVVMITVFALSSATIWLIGKVTNGNCRWLHKARTAYV